MVNYQNAKIYKLVGGGLTYYGSTCSELRYRLYKHKSKFNDCKSKLLFETDDKVEIILVEKYPCNDKMELHQRERYYIENFECVNHRVPSRQFKEYSKIYREHNKDKLKQYREDNKDKLRLKKKQYIEENKDEIRLKKKQYYENNKDKINLRKKQLREQNKK